MRHRGERYFASGAVELQTLRPEARSATVVGSRPYTGEARRDRHGIRVSCDCPNFQRTSAGRKHLLTPRIARQPQPQLPPPRRIAAPKTARPSSSPKIGEPYLDFLPHRCQETTPARRLLTRRCQER
jgi:hypothetical protein